MRELGSEFWQAETSQKKMSHWWDVIGCDRQYYVSGRTALDAILYDIQRCNECRSAYLPSYFCSSMVAPFLKNGINIKFYSVIFSNGKLVIDYKEEHGCDIVYFMEYFGYYDANVHEFINFESKKKVIIIQDATHSLMQEKPCSKLADYVFVSFRKWTAVLGAGIAIKMRASFDRKMDDLPIYKNYINVREQAMTLKAGFMKGQMIEKKLFLDMFNGAESLLDEDYAGYGIDSQSKKIIDSLDISYIRKKRLENANLLINELKDCENMTLMFSELPDGDCPLHVPVLVKGNLRNVLRKYLINQQVYCPIHWPLVECYAIRESDKQIYNSELSLLCDQRYEIEEMEHEVYLIKGFMAEVY